MSCINGHTRGSSRSRTGFESSEGSVLVVDVFCFDLQFLLAGFANPVVFAINEGMVVDTFTVVFGAEFTFHEM